jgi:hypothetical protein
MHPMFSSRGVGSPVKRRVAAITATRARRVTVIACLFVAAMR